MADGGAPSLGGQAIVGPTPAQCRLFVALARESAQLNVDPGKVDFLRLRLSRRLRALDLADFDAYEAMLRADPAGPERACLVEALTTHTTSFFREKHQYDWLAGDGLDLLGRDGRGFDQPLTVWSAACSTGAELWSAAMVLADRASRPGGLRRFRLFGTDISRPILRKAASATYTEEEIAGVPGGLVARFLMRSKAGHGPDGKRFYRIAPELRTQASFAVANLTDPAGLPPIAADVVFLRNVLIYFEPAVQVQVVDAVAARIRPGGFLLTGHAEAIPPRPKLVPVGPSIYRRE